MKWTNEYRIVDDMGYFYPQRKAIGFRGREIWKNERSLRCGCHESYWADVICDTRMDAEKWLGMTIAERELESELRERGPVVVKRVFAAKPKREATK